ncbi:ribosome maturation factor RimM [Cuspidothrix issatschenkoi]|uniref:Ribosome maturation factor RimM n=1 Tax=Cuspidothrix issatschenkoi CHARLIE-1 TaxID=2052836 RepID=A0A2S6CX09_9CYAN|nr:ribosome maturation factor RimM [Cuspidothrix issatschenkoi]PPJ64325.1 ribosome maturation factor RimM [Cuspidothrix issatschenkoi CHARLIE-1]
MNHEGTKNTKQPGSRAAGKQEGKAQKSPVPSPVQADKRDSQPIPNLDNWIEIGKIVSPQGLTGELRVYPNTDFPERFEEPGKRWLLRPGETEPQPVELLYGRYIENKNLYVIKLEGVGDRHQAENIRDCRLFVPISDRPELAEGEFHVVDLLGLPVFMQSSGQLLGTVVDILPSGHDLLEVKLDATFAENKAGKTVLIPFVMAIVPVVDLETRRIEITPPSGLLSIND